MEVFPLPTAGHLSENGEKLNFFNEFLLKSELSFAPTVLKALGIFSIIVMVTWFANSKNQFRLTGNSDKQGTDVFECNEDCIC